MFPADVIVNSSAPLLSSRRNLEKVAANRSSNSRGRSDRALLGGRSSAGKAAARARATIGLSQARRRRGKCVVSDSTLDLPDREGPRIKRGAGRSEREGDAVVTGKRRLSALLR